MGMEWLVIGVPIGILFIWKVLPMIFWLLIELVFRGIDSEPQSKVKEHEDRWRGAGYNVTTDRVGFRHYSKASHPQGPEIQVTVPTSYAPWKFGLGLLILLALLGSCGLITWTQGWW